MLSHTTKTEKKVKKIESGEGVLPIGGWNCQGQVGSSSCRERKLFSKGQGEVDLRLKTKSKLKPASEAMALFIGAIFAQERAKQKGGRSKRGGVYATPPHHRRPMRIEQRTRDRGLIS